MRAIKTCLAVLTLLVALPSAGRAQDLASYAVLVGSNEGGAGQARLAYAEADAERMRDVLAELGRIPRGRITLLVQPSVADLERALAALRQQLAAHAQRGERSQVVFYYSGHARSRALSLGREELPLEQLRAALRALPTTLTLVVLDACQSGEFSGVKGAAPAADFSASTLNELTSEGIAVMASSTGSELSQESHRLGSSFFTHHLIASLRGAGDSDADGRVSLDEAYRYAYQHTLADTARTAVGSQHATLETELRGKGQVALSYPVDADARLELPKAVEGRVLVQLRSGAVMAELTKVRGDAVTLALPSGRYTALIRAGAAPRARSCDVELGRGRTHALAPASCPEVELEDEASKGEGPRELWFVELGIAVNAEPDDDYDRTLEAFRYQRQEDVYIGDGGLSHEAGYGYGIDGALGYGITRHLSVLGRFDQLEKKRYERSLHGPDGQTRHESFEWVTRAVSVGARGRWPLAREWFVPLAELDLGLGFARSTLEGEGVDVVERDFGVALRAVGGFTVGLGQRVGAYAVAGYTFAPVLDNRIGDTHDDGGYTLATGIRLRSIHGWW